MTVKKRRGTSMMTLNSRLQPQPSDYGFRGTQHPSVRRRPRRSILSRLKSKEADRIAV